MSRLKDKAMATAPPKPKKETIIKEVTPAIQNPDNTQKGRGIKPPSR